MKIHPIPGIGFPPMSRPSSNNQGCSAWNSWKESLERTWASTRLGHPEDEGVTPADGPGRRRDQLPVGHGLVEHGPLGRVDAVAEGGVHHHDDLGAGILGLEFPDGVVELLEARRGTAFGRDVRAVDDDMGRGHDFGPVNHPGGPLGTDRPASSGSDPDPDPPSAATTGAQPGSGLTRRSAVGCARWTHDTAGEVAELLQQMISNACVNDGTPESGHEQRNAEVLQAVLDRPGLDLEIHEPLPGRSSLVARIEGRRPGAPSLALLGHTDVVPANGDDWRHDPFGGELIDGEVWDAGPSTC